MLIWGSSEARHPCWMKFSVVEQIRTKVLLLQPPAFAEVFLYDLDCEAAELVQLWAETGS